MTIEISNSRSLHRLIYFSRQALPDGADVDAEIRRIIETSVRRNSAAEITGLLFHHDEWFVQALEGPTEQVMTTYRRILNDHRHKDSKVIVAGPANRREFGGWAMCARQLGPTDAAIISTLRQKGSFEPPKLTAASALRLLQAVRQVKNRAAA